MSEFNDTLERISMQLEQIEESLPRRPLWKRRLLEDLLSGAARGIGFSIGFTVLGALLLYVLAKHCARQPAHYWQISGRTGAHCRE